MQCEFVPKFKPKYEKTGKKNLRCFPTCSNSGHITTGFCGTPVCCKINMSMSDVVRFSTVGTNLARIQFWGEIRLSVHQPSLSRRPKQCEEEESEPREFKLDHFLLQERSKLTPNKTYLRGVVLKLSRLNEEKAQITVAFNEKKLSWHYQWHSSKTTCDANHCFKVCVVSPIIFQPSSHQANTREVVEKLVVVQIFRSKSFKLYSRHRVRKMREMVKNGIKVPATSLPEYDKNFLEKVKTSIQAKPATSIKPYAENNKLHIVENALKRRKMKDSYENVTSSRSNLNLPAFSTQAQLGRNKPILPQIPGQYTHLHPFTGYTGPILTPPSSKHLQILLDQIRTNYPYDIIRQQNINQTSLSSSVPLDIGQLGNICILDLNSQNRLDFVRLVLVVLFYCQAEPESLLRSLALLENDTDPTKMCQEALKSIFMTFVVNAGVKSTLQSTSIENPLNLESHLHLGVKAFRKLALQKGSDTLKLNIDKLVLILEQIAKDLLVEIDLSDGIATIFNTWNTDLSKLSIMKGSQLNAIKNSTNHDDVKRLIFTDTLKFNSQYGRLLSLDQEIYQELFKFVSKKLSQNRVSLNNFSEILELASNSCLIPLVNGKAEDNELSRISRKLFCSITKSTVVPSNCFDCMTKLLRELCCESVRKRVQQEKYLEDFASNSSSLTSQDEENLVYLQGQWEFESIQSENNNLNRHLLEYITFNLIGVSSKSLVGKLFLRMFSRFHTKISKKAIYLQGQKKLLTNPLYKFILDGIPRLLSIPFPIPFPGNNLDVIVCSWIKPDKNNQLARSIRVVIEGDLIDRELALETYLTSQQMRTTKFRIYLSLGLSVDFTSLKINMFALLGQDFKNAPPLVNLEQLKQHFILIEKEKTMVQISYKRGFYQV